MRSRCCTPVFALLLAGCSYPTFSFVEGDAGAPDTAIAIDSTTPVDTFVDETFVVDTFVDDTTTAPDTTVVDTATAPDTFKPDTFKPDTSTPPLDVGVDGGTTKGCAGTTHFFCRDFDSVATPDEGWTGSYLQGTGTMALSKSLFRSPPNAFLSTIGSATTGETSANLNRAFSVGSVTTKVRVDADIYLDSGTYPGGTLLIKVQTPGSGRGVALAVGPPGLYVDFLGTTTKTTVLGPAPAKKWFHVRLEASLRITSGVGTVYIDDMTKPAFDATGSTTDTEGTTRNVVVGLYTSGTSFPYQAYFDDVSMDLVP